LGQLDPRTKLAMGLMAMVAVFIARRPETLFAESIIILISVPLLGMGRDLIRSFRLIWPMLFLVFVIAYLSFDIRVSILMSIRLFNLLTVSFLFFRSISPEEMGDALKKLGVPYGPVFILTTAMRYVPLIGQKLRQIMDAQVSRGIDLRPRLKNVVNFMALLMPLLVQSFMLSDDLAIAMESRGFNRKNRSSRRQYHISLPEYALIAASLTILVAFWLWERG